MKDKLANFKSIIGAPENRRVVLIWSVMIVGFLLLLSSLLFKAGNVRLSDTEISAKVNGGQVAFGTGNESPEYLKTIETYNNETVPLLRQDNPSSLPIPILSSEPDGGMCADGYRTWQDCLLATVGDGDLCVANDTACMIDNGLIPPDLCAPADYACMEQKGLSPEKLMAKLMGKGDGSALCAKSDSACIERLAKELGCSSDDLACLVSNGIIDPLCAANDAACIAIAAAKVGCNKDDVACLVRNGVIPPLCASSDSVCIAKQAALLGCKSDDTRCLIKKGIIRSAVQQALCQEGDSACIINQAALLGCDAKDVACLVAKGIIAPLCESSDAACIAMEAAKKGCEKTDIDCLVRKGIISKPTKGFKCAPDDKICIARHAKASGCNEDDVKCLVENRIIPPKCLEGDRACIERAAVLVGCSPSDRGCLEKFGIVARSDTSLATETNNSSPTDYSSATYTSSKCDSKDTLCMRAVGDIGMSDCAPDDATCKARKLLQMSNTASTNTSSKSSNANDYSAKAADKEYLKQMASHMKKVSGRKAVEVDFWEKVESKNQTTEQESLASSVTQQVENTEPTKPMLPPMFKAGRVYYATNEIALNTDIEGPVAISLIQGPGDSYMLQGKMVHKEDYARLELDTLIHPNGETQRINAIALDPETGYAAVASEVDSHIVYRYGWWGLGYALQAAGKAAQLAAKEVIITENGTVVESSELDSEQELAVALGELGAKVGEEFSKRLDRPKTVYVYRNAELAVYFMETVYPIQTGDNSK